MVTFSGCSGKEGTKTCTVKGGGGGEGTVITTTLDGELGTTTEAPSGVALLLLPTTGHVFVTIEGTCLEPKEAAVEGTIAGEASPIGKYQTTGKLIFGGGAGVQSIKSVVVLGVTVKAKLTAFGSVAASENTSEAITFSKPVEVT